MNLTDGNLYFKDVSNIKYKYDYLTDDIECDVLIVGGGITGAITAYYQSLLGLNVVIVDKNIIGYGSTMATTAIMEYQIDKDLSKLISEIGEIGAYKCFKMCYEAIGDIENIISNLKLNVDFKRKCSLYISDKNKNYLKKEYELRKKCFNVSFKIDNELKYKYIISLYNGSATMNPYLFTSELINKLFKNGVKVYENTNIVNIDNKKIVLATTNNGFKIKANKCILTTGFEGVNYLKKNTIKLYKTFAIVTEVLDLVSDDYTARDTLIPYHYIRFDNNRIIYGGEDILINDYSKKNINNIYNKLYKDFIKTFPKYKGCKVEYKFNGTFANTSDTLPVVDKLGPSLYCNFGYGANGILYSVIGAKMIARNRIYKAFKVR